MHQRICMIVIDMRCTDVMVEIWQTVVHSDEDEAPVQNLAEVDRRPGVVGGLLGDAAKGKKVSAGRMIASAYA